MNDTDDECTCPPPHDEGAPLDLHDFIGIGCGLISAIAGNISSFWAMTGNEFYASARYRRARKAAIEREMQESERMAAYVAVTRAPDDLGELS